MKLPRRDTLTDPLAHEWSLMMMRRAFRDLAASFATVDAALADEAVKRIEIMVADELSALRKKSPEGISIVEFDAVMHQVVPPLREMTQGARSLIQQAGKPKN